MTAKGKIIPVAALAIATLVSACSEEVTNQKIEEFRRTGNVDLTVGELLSGVIPQEQTAPAAKPQPVYRRTTSVAPSTAKTQPTYRAAPLATPTPVILPNPGQAKVSTAKRQVVLDEEADADKVEVNLID